MPDIEISLYTWRHPYKPSGPWAACDAYQLWHNEWVQAAYKEMCFEYYIKFAIGKSGKLLLLVSCHEPQDRG